MLLGILLLPVQYRVRCTCELDVMTRRFAVAPFDGIVKEGFVEPGDLVQQGQRLASMDGTALTYQMATVKADLAKARKLREIELKHRDIPKSMVAGLEAESLEAEQQLLEFQKAQIEVRSPVDGIILSGSLEKSVGASATQGQTLFEVGPIDQLIVEIAIPADEIAHVRSDQTVRVWVDGFESSSFTGMIESIAPRSELRDARNVFVAEIRIDNQDGRLRPGMKGRVRIDCDRHPLGWNLFHKPANFILSRLTWW